jgi:hypothetical protein
MTCVRFARYTAITTEKLATTLIALTERLESSGVLRADRPSKVARDAELTEQRLEAQKHQQRVTDLLQLIPNHPDADELVKCLFQDLRVTPLSVRPKPPPEPVPKPAHANSRAVASESVRSPSSTEGTDESEDPGSGEESEDEDEEGSTESESEST